MGKKSIVAALLAVCLLLSGCASLTFQNTNELLRAPALGEEQGEIQKALAATLDQEPQFKFPKEGGMQSPLLIADLDGDGNDEGAVLYSVQDSAAGVQDKGSQVYLAILEKQDKQWVVTQDALGLGSDVASFDVADLLGDGSQQLIVGYAAANLSNKTLALYQYSDNQLIEVYHTPYSRYALGDFTGQGGTDLVWVSRDDQVGDLQLLHMPVEAGAFTAPHTPVKLESNITACDGLYPSLGANGSRVLVVDGVVANNMLASQLVYFSGEHFYTLDDATRLLGDSARANPLLKARDIDGNGVVEIPIPVSGSIQVEAGDKQLQFIEWIDFITGEPTVKNFGLLDSNRGVYTSLPGSWQGNITVTDGVKEDEWVVRDRETERSLVRLKTLEADEEMPSDDVVRLPGFSNTYLIASKTLSKTERSLIRTLLLV